MNSLLCIKKCPVVSIVNQKGGVGKTTTAINLAQALALLDLKILVVDLDPQANATRGMGVPLEKVELSVADLIRDRELPTERGLYSGSGIDLIPSSPLLAKVAREMIGMTNSELRIAQRLAKLKSIYDCVVIDTAPTFGPLTNSAFNASDSLIVPVDAGFYALMGIKELLAEIGEIRGGTNKDLKILGYLLTLADHTNITQETLDGLLGSFGDLVFKSKIRRSVRLKEAPVVGKTIFHYDPKGPGWEDYLSLAREVMTRLEIAPSPAAEITQEVSHV